MSRFRVISPVAAIWSAPDGARERQLLMGDIFIAATETETHLKGVAEKDGYPGFVKRSDLAPEPALPAPTHTVSAIRTYAKRAPGIKDTSARMDLSFACQLHVTASENRWSAVSLRPGTPPVYVPSTHLAPLGTAHSDPVAIAESFLGTPYLWGGNSAFGIDCSGLVQIACHACGMDCPGDSGPQERAMGETITTKDYKRGDLLFWKGHVAWVAGPDTLIHANAHHMAVAYEPIGEAITRIASQGDGPVTRHARLHPSRGKPARA